MYGDARLELGEQLLNQGFQRPLVVSDATMERLGFLKELCEALENSGLTVATVLVSDREEPSDLSIQPVLDGLRGHKADAVLALGGGSVIDSTKAAALLYAHGGLIEHYKFPVPIPDAGVPVYAIPTTAGTGSEATAATVITHVASGEKMLLMGPALIPACAVVDYCLSMTQPQRLTADTGLDALTHALEAYVSRKATEHTDVIALRAMEGIYGSLRCAYHHGNEEARREMMHCATYAGIAFSNASVALVHGMSRPIGARYHVPHGLSNAMLLPALTAYSLSAAKARYAACARSMGIADDSLSDDQAGMVLVTALQNLVEELQVPTLEGFGIDRQDFLAAAPEMATQALASGSPGNNPRVPQGDDMVTLYELVFDGAPLEEIAQL